MSDTEALKTGSELSVPNQRLMDVGQKDGTWTTLDYSDRLFAMGGNIYGSKTALMNLSVSAMCVDVISQDASKAPLHLRRRTARGSEVVRPSRHPVARLLSSGPNVYMGRREFVRYMAANLAVDSEFYVAARRNNADEILEFSGIQKNNVTNWVNPEVRGWYYNISPGTLHEQALYGWAQGMMSARDVAHIRLRSFNGQDVLSTSSISKSSLKILSDMQKFQGNIYTSGGIPQLAFAFPDSLTEEQYARLIRGLEKALKKAQETGMPLVLEGDGVNLPKVEKLSQSAGDTEFMASMGKIGLDVARHWRVPPHKLYLLENVKYDNQSEQERIYVHDTLFSYFDMIEEGLDRCLLTDNERDDYFFAFDREKAFALDPVAHQKIVESRWTKGMVTQDEMRDAIGLNQIGGEQGDRRLYMGGNSVMVDGDGEVVMRAGGGPGDAETDEPEKSKPKKKSDDRQLGLQLVSSN